MVEGCWYLKGVCQHYSANRKRYEGVGEYFVE